ncbi:MAG: ABC transporter ATP-binding protein [Acidimicrobiales bacterium]|nr:ABC transporter ATP-binding protein [Acidimicrobiales bacterium]MCB9371595.1 ABC transporter ATP-binding protein [Microthrixaceae bacterium]
MPGPSSAPASGVEVRSVSKRFDAAPVLRDVDLTVPPGAIVVLLGPSGCGKTTLLRTVAGLERPDAGEIRVGGALVAADGVHVAPEQRRVGLVFQDWALFPHLSVARNVAYGVPRGPDRAERTREALALVGLESLGDRSPATLSGGQKQRVALARALAPRPAVLLLDEPFSNLDTALRAELRTEVHRLLRALEVTAVFVTHDQEEAFVLGDEVAVLLDGRLVQQAPPAELYARPASPWVARFVGDANLVDGRASAGVAETPLGRLPLAGSVDGAVSVLVRPEDLDVEAGDDGVVELVEFHGHDTVYEVVVDGGPRVRARAGAAPRHARGDRVTVRYRGAPTTAWPVSRPR